MKVILEMRRAHLIRQIRVFFSEYTTITLMGVAWVGILPGQGVWGRSLRLSALGFFCYNFDVLIVVLKFHNLAN